MVQNELLFDILDLLRRERLHVRALAEKLGTNHISVMRVLKILYNDNIVDYKVEGKNKVYYLKNVLVARKKILSLEQYKFEKLIKKYPHLNPLISDILELVRHKTVILFGSFAKFMANKESDIDIFVETQDRNLRKKIMEIDSRLSIKIGRFDKSSHLGKEIIKDHIILRGAEEFYEKYKIFEEIAFEG